jgi:hypothetical protein
MSRRVSVSGAASIALARSRNMWWQPSVGSSTATPFLFSCAARFLSS